MAHDGPRFYDDPTAFAIYQQHRERADNANDTLERPVVLELLGDVRGLDVLDLGCGDGAFGKDLLDAGAASYCGVDGSTNMIAAAQSKLNGTRGVAHLAELQQWAYPTDSADRVTARLVLHYLENFEPIFAGVHRALRPGGRFVFSVEHPVITSCDKVWGGDGLRQDWVVDDYFVTGRRVTTWLGAEVVKYHRTVEDYFLALQAAGFTVQSVRESRPERRHFADDEQFARRQRIPLFLFMAAEKHPRGP